MFRVGHRTELGSPRASWLMITPAAMVRKQSVNYSMLEGESFFQNQLTREK